MSFNDGNRGFDLLQRDIRYTMFFDKKLFPHLTDPSAIKRVLSAVAAEMASCSLEEFMRKSTASSMKVSIETDILGVNCIKVQVSTLTDLLPVTVDFQTHPHEAETNIRQSAHALIDHLLYGGNPTITNHNLYRGTRITMPSGLVWLDTTPQSPRI